MKRTHIVIGTSAAGIGVINRLARLAPEDRIIGISSEYENPYNTCLLADYCAGYKSEQELSIFNAGLAKATISLQLGLRVEGIDSRNKQVLCAGGRTFSYDTLFIGTGTSAIPPSIPGITQGTGIFTFHTMADCQQVMQYVKEKRVKQAVVIGAGLTGLESADALRAQGIQVSVVERENRVLTQLVSQDGSFFIQSAMNQMGVAFYGNDPVVQICHRNQEVIGIELNSGIFIPADMVIVAVGATRNDALARQAGLLISPLGIITDSFLQTSVEGIWAGGDVAQVLCAFTQQPVASCTWPDAMLQGLTAAHAMVGEKKVYAGATRIVDSAFFGLKFQAGGVSFGSHASAEIVLEHSKETVSSVFKDGEKNIGYFTCSIHEIPHTVKKMVLCG